MKKFLSKMAEFTLSLRKTLAGKHILKMYKTEKYRKIAAKMAVT